MLNIDIWMLTFHKFVFLVKRGLSHMIKRGDIVQNIAHTGQLHRPQAEEVL